MALRVPLPCAVTLRYRLAWSIVGMYHDEREVTTIPAGAIVVIPHTPSEVGIVSAIHNGRMIRVFLHDLLAAGLVESDAEGE
jgi:hypothetical protein